MEPEKGRWLFVVLGLLINLCIGSVYAWSVFTKPLSKLFMIGATESIMPYTVSLAIFAITMPLIGSALDKYGPRKIAIIGSCVVGIGWFLSTLATNIWVLVITYGIIGGAGVGIVYNCPIGVAGRWFPDRRGLAVGATLFGFGLSAFITAPLANMFIESYGPIATFGYLGIIFLILITLFALPLQFPPQGWRPSGWVTSSSATVQCCDRTRSEMVRTRSFWGIWFSYVIGTLAGLMAIGIASPVGQEIFLLGAPAAAAFTGLFSTFNGIGRPLFGYVVDKISFRITAIISFGIIFVATLLLGSLGGPGTTIIYFIGFAALCLSLGGWLAIAPACTAAFFGTKYYGPNYGLMFTAYGLGALIGSQMAGRMRDIVGSYSAVFYPVAFLALIGGIIAYIFIKPPEEPMKSK